jgi:hypothetical protein
MNILKLFNYFIQINHNISSRQSISDIDFNITINQINKTNQNDIYEIDLSTIMLTINSTNFYQNNSNSVLYIDWFIISNNSFDSNKPILQIPIQIQYDDIQVIVALTDFTRLINTAMLSMQTEQFPLKILAVNHSGYGIFLE